MAGRKSKISAQTFLWMAYFLMLCGWLITIIGVIALQESCHRRNRIDLNPQFRLQNAANTRVPFGLNGGCKRVLHWYWFIWAFEFIAAVGIPLTLFRGALWKGWHTGWIGVLAVKTVLNMIAANDGLDMTYQHVNSLWRTRVFFAGFAISAAADLLMMLALGHLGFTHRHEEKDYAAAHYATGQYAPGMGMTGRSTVPAAQTV